MFLIVGNTILFFLIIFSALIKKLEVLRDRTFGSLILQSSRFYQLLSVSVQVYIFMTLWIEIAGEQHSWVNHIHFSLANRDSHELNVKAYYFSRNHALVKKLKNVLILDFASTLRNACIKYEWNWLRNSRVLVLYVYIHINKYSQFYIC